MLKKAEGSTASHAVSKNRSECCDEHWCPRTLLHARVRDKFSGTRVRGGSSNFRELSWLSCVPVLALLQMFNV